MKSNPLHITNGDSLTNYIIDLDIATIDSILTWQEMLSVGPTTEIIESEAFLKLRKKFFKDFYNIELTKNEIAVDIKELDEIDTFSEIILWFEYDLFCHINMVAVISLLQQRGVTLPIYVVTSGRIKGEPDLKALTELTPKQLQEHYKEKVLLNVDDISFATTIWRIYCSNKHQELLPLVVRKSSFKYMSICLKAHIKRFPDTRSGLSTLEYNILTLIKENKITSRRHLLGYTLHYQGYYAYGDLQLERLINLMSHFYNEDEEFLTLNEKGDLALEHKHNYQNEMNNTMVFGGAKSLDFKFDKELNKIIKNN